LIEGETDPEYDQETEEEPHKILSYKLSFLWRQLVYKKWLFVELEPELDFRDEHDYRANPGNTLMLEANFQDFK